MERAAHCVASRDDSSKIMLEIHGAFTTVHLSAERRQQVPRAVLDRSSVLRQVLDHNEAAEHQYVSVPQLFLERWLQWRTHESSWDNSFGNDPARMAALLEAADYLGDEEGCRKLCRQAAEAMLPHPPGQTPVCTNHLQVLEALPSNLLQSILATCRAPVTHTMSVLPPRFHMAALHAAYPTIASDATIHISVRDALAPEEMSRRFWALLGELSSIQHLSIDLMKQYEHASFTCRGPLPTLTSLTYLKLNGTTLPLSDGSTEGNGWDISHLIMLQHLELVATTHETENMQLLAPQLRGLTLLKHLDLSINSIGLYGAEHLAESLPILSNVQHLALESNGLDNAAMVALVPSITSLHQLTYLSLRNNNSETYEGLEVQLFSSLSKLKELNISQCVLSKLMLPQLALLRELQSLNISGALAEDLTVLEVPKYLAQMTRLSYLNLNHNEIHDEDMIALAPSLGCLSELRVLDVGANLFMDDGMTAMIRHVSHITALHGLHIRTYHLRSSGVPAVARYLQALPALQSLSLGWRLSPDDAIIVVTALSGLTSLTMLNIFAIWNEGSMPQQAANSWQLLAQCLRKLQRLRQFTMAGGDFDNAESAALAPSIGELQALEELTIEGIRADQDILLALSPHLQGLTSLRVLRFLVHSQEEGDLNILFEALDSALELRELEIAGFDFTAGRVKLVMDFVVLHGSLQSVHMETIDAQGLEVMQDYDERSIVTC